MTTALAQQLQQLAVAAGTHVGKHKPVGKASLLWEAREAADIDIETVYDVAIQGTRGRGVEFESKLGYMDRNCWRMHCEEWWCVERLSAVPGRPRQAANAAVRLVLFRARGGALFLKWLNNAHECACVVLRLGVERCFSLWLPATPRALRRVPSEREWSYES